MEDIWSKYIVYTQKEGCNVLKLYSEVPSIHPLYDKLLENARIQFNDNNSITVEGEEWQYGIEFHDECPSNFDYEIHPSSITKTRFRKKDIVRSGWHRKMENKHFKMITNKYNIII